VILVYKAAAVSVKLFFWATNISLVVLSTLTAGMRFVVGSLVGKLTAGGGDTEWT
jgi:hypothetical protein